MTTRELTQVTERFSTARGIGFIYSAGTVVVAAVFCYASGRNIWMAVETLYMSMQEYLRHQGHEPLTVVNVILNSPDIQWWVNLRQHQLGTVSTGENLWEAVTNARLPHVSPEFDARYFAWQYLLVSLMVMVVAGQIFLHLVRTVPRPEELSPINQGLGAIRLRGTPTDLPVLKIAGNFYGLRARPKIRRGRREHGSAVVVGMPGSGKSRLLMRWLQQADALSFIVIDMKGELARMTGAHRRTLGPVLSFDFTSVGGQSLDPLETDDQLAAQRVMNVLFPQTAGENGHFQRSSIKIALAIWSVTRSLAMPSMVPLILFPTYGPTGMIAMLRSMIASVKERQLRDRLWRQCGAAFGEAFWETPERGAGNEERSALSTITSTLTPYRPHEILTTFLPSDMQVADLICGLYTLYIKLPETETPYSEVLDIQLDLFVRQFPHDNAASRPTTFLLADEAGALFISSLKYAVQVGRTAGIGVAMFLQDTAQMNQYRPLTLASFPHYLLFRSNNAEDMRLFEAILPTYKRLDKDKKGQVYEDIRPTDDVQHNWTSGKGLLLVDDVKRHVLYGDVVSPANVTELYETGQDSSGEEQIQCLLELLDTHYHAGLELLAAERKRRRKPDEGEGGALF